MIRQYRIVVKEAGSTEEPVMLEPTVHASLYNLPEIRDSVKYVDANPYIRMVAMEVGSKLYSIVVIYHDSLITNHFQLSHFNE